MREQIISQLKAKLLTLGVKNLSNTRINAIADKLAPKIQEESQIDDKLDELNELFPFAEIAKQDDQLRTLSQKPKPQPNNPSPEPNPEPQPEEVPAWAKSLIQEVTQFRAEKVQQSLSAKLHEKLKEKKIPLDLADGIKLEKEEDLDTVFANVETKYTNIKQHMINDGFSQSSAPVGGSTTLKSDNLDSDIQAWAEKNK